MDILGYGYEENIAFSFSCFKMPDMTGVQQVEDPMALDNLFATVF
jgi:hypothetical protein